MDKKQNSILWLDSKDNVIVALRTLTAGEILEVDGNALTVKDEIPKGHKMSIRLIREGDMVVKYGEDIGEAKNNIEIGQHVHVHNVRDITAEVTERERRRLGL